MDMQQKNTYSEKSVLDETSSISNSNKLNENQDFQAVAKHINLETANETESHVSLIKESRDDKKGIEKSCYDTVISKNNENFESYDQKTCKKDKPSSDSDKPSGERATEQVADTNTAVNDNCIETSINSFVVTETKSEDLSELMSLAKESKLSDNVLTTETNETVKLTKGNLQKHTRLMHERVKAADNVSKPGSPKQKENTIHHDTQNDKVNRSPGTCKTSLLERGIAHHETIETLVNRELSRAQEQGKRNICTNKSQKVKIKQKEKKKYKINVDDVETLVSRDKLSDTENRKRGNNKAKETISWNYITSQKSKPFNEFSGIGKDIVDKGDVADDTEKPRDTDGGTRIDEGPAFKHQNLVRRSVKPTYMKRPVYDALNTSTQLILLNNKYGKHSRLWKAQVTQPNRTPLIDPKRHLREPSFYLSGHFHSRCSTSECPKRHTFTPSQLKFDFSGRPNSEKIGDHLYEARHSKNPKRHRTCTRTPEGWQKPLDFSAPNWKTTLPVYVFEWERVYAEPPLRTSRPPTSRSCSTVTGRKIGNQPLRLPQLTSDPDAMTLRL